MRADRAKHFGGDGSSTIEALNTLPLLHAYTGCALPTRGNVDVKLHHHYKVDLGTAFTEHLSLKQFTARFPPRSVSFQAPFCRGESSFLPYETKTKKGERDSKKTPESSHGQRIMRVRCLDTDPKRYGDHNASLSLRKNLSPGYKSRVPQGHQHVRTSPRDANRNAGPPPHRKKVHYPRF